MLWLLFPLCFHWLKLIKDQCERLRHIGISSISLSDVNTQEEIHLVESGCYSVIYATPESLLKNERWRRMLSSDLFFCFLVFHPSLVAFNAYWVRVYIYVDVQRLVYKSVKVNRACSFTTRFKDMYRTRCLEVTASEQIKPFVSLFNNFFGVKSFVDTLPIISSCDFNFFCICGYCHSGLAFFLAANVTRNMIGAAANNYMHVIGSQ